MLFTVLSFLTNNVKSMPVLILLGLLAWVSTTLSELQTSVDEVKVSIAVMNESIRAHIQYTVQSKSVPAYIPPTTSPNKGVTQ